MLLARRKSFYIKDLKIYPQVHYEKRKSNNNKDLHKQDFSNCEETYEVAQCDMGKLNIHHCNRSRITARYTN